MRRLLVEPFIHYLEEGREAYKRFPFHFLSAEQWQTQGYIPALLPPSVNPSISHQIFKQIREVQAGKIEPHLTAMRSDDPTKATKGLIELINALGDSLFERFPAARTRLFELLKENRIPLALRSELVELLQEKYSGDNGLMNVLKYVTFLRERAIEIVPSFVQPHSSSSTSIDLITARALQKETRFLQENLPDHFDSPILFQFDEGNFSHIKMLIVGARGTPYSGGVFIFDIDASSYPNSPPKVTLLTTNGGLFRFNPNLYANGYVCLSLLGTWQGIGATESWQPGVSNLLQVALAIQSAVMNSNPYINEPGWANSGDTPEAKEYAKEIERGTVEYAILGQLKNPDPNFAEFIRLHFQTRQDEILSTIHGWSKVTSAQKNEFAALVE